MEDFLVAIHFGKKDMLARCVSLAYRDLQRTIRGVSKFDKSAIPELVRHLLEEARAAESQESFDRWHERACDQIVMAFRQIGYEKFTVGQAQKWLNMALKYVFVLGNRVPGFEHLHPYCHVPLDQFLMSQAAKHGFRLLPGTAAWSTLTDYQVYMDRQRWFRTTFGEVPPLVTEFRLWLDYVHAQAEPRT